MKNIIIILTVLFFTLWYAGMNKIELCKKTNTHYLSTAELSELDEKKSLNSPIDYNSEYYTTYKVSYLLKRGFIPFTYIRDTLNNEGLRYYKE